MRISPGSIVTFGSSGGVREGRGAAWGGVATFLGAFWACPGAGVSWAESVPGKHRPMLKITAGVVVFMVFGRLVRTIRVLGNSVERKDASRKGYSGSEYYQPKWGYAELSRPLQMLGIARSR